MTKKNLLFLFPAQLKVLAKRKDVYLHASKYLHKNLGYNVVFVYNGPKIEADIEGVTLEHFDEWAAANEELVNKTNILDLEKEFPECNFWRIAVVERKMTEYSFLAGTEPHSNYSIEEIDKIIKELVLFYKYVIEKHNITAAFNQVSDNMHSHAVYELAQHYGIPALSLGFGTYWLKGKFYPQDHVSFKSSLLGEVYEYFCSHFEEKVAPIEKALDAKINEIREKDASKSLPGFFHSKNWKSMTKNAARTIRLNIGGFSLSKPDPKEVYYKIETKPAIRAYLDRLYNDFQKKRIVKKFDLPNEPFVFFPLHLQPEAILLGASPGYLDQLALIRLLSASLPAGYRLVVKDHPITGGMHEKEFYQAIQNLPNVCLLDERVNSRDIIAKASLIATISGTIGFEALISGKPALMFGQVYYDCMNTVLKPPANLNEMPYFMKRVLALGEHPTKEEINKDIKIFLAAWMSLMVDGGDFYLDYGDDFYKDKDKAEYGRMWAETVHGLLCKLAEAKKAYRGR